MTDVTQHPPCPGGPKRTEEAYRKAFIRPRAVFPSGRPGRSVSLPATCDPQSPSHPVHLLRWAHQCLLRGHDYHRSPHQRPGFSNAKCTRAAVESRHSRLTRSCDRAVAERSGFRDLSDRLCLHDGGARNWRLWQLCGKFNCGM